MSPLQRFRVGLLIVDLILICVGAVLYILGGMQGTPTLLLFLVLATIFQWRNLRRARTTDPTPDPRKEQRLLQIEVLVILAVFVVFGVGFFLRPVLGPQGVQAVVTASAVVLLLLGMVGYIRAGRQS